MDRSRMALCAFTLLFLSFNPMASLLYAGWSSSGVSVSGNHGGRTVLGVEEAGTWNTLLLIVCSMHVVYSITMFLYAWNKICELASDFT